MAEVVIPAGYQRVTDVLAGWIDPAYHNWVVEVGRVAANQVGKKAMAIGKRVDAMIQDEINKGQYRVLKADGKEVQNCLQAWEKFKREHSPKVVSHHVRHFHDESKTTGEYDIELEDTLVDLKCGNRITPKYWLQVAWYNHISGLNKPNIAILRLDPFWATYEYRVKPMNEAYLRVFESVQTASSYFSYREELA